ncbi:hypothetical protein [Verrucomicrobium spinosum]|uniref:hypothetical protein n=1 Tax=Verrucomicrobium spinosum TaxID=2736 RepID=UPI0001745E65|nr:hypothetical protein [Verrucomicrobium spinosum]
MQTATIHPAQLPTRTNLPGALTGLDCLETIPGISSVAVQLTPEMARRMLERNLRNRKLSEQVVDKYVEEIRNDEWRLTPAAVGFDCEGRLVDGQHRLTAIVKSRRTVPMIVTTGLPAAAQEKVDRQRRRSLFDALYLSGQVRNRKWVEIATCLARRVVASNSGTAPPDSVVKLALETHREAIEAVTDQMGEKSVKGISQASFLAAAVLYHEVDSDKCREFLAAIRTGAGLALDHPALRLRKLLMGESLLHSMPRGGANQSYIFRRSIYAMQAHLEGRMIGGLREADNFASPFVEEGAARMPRRKARRNQEEPASDLRRGAGLLMTA